MKKIVFALSLVLLSGCSLIPEKESNQIDSTHTGNQLQIESTISGQAITSGDSIQTVVSDQTKNELEQLYGYENISFGRIYTVGNYIIADADSGSDQPGAGFIIVAGKQNNQWYRFYEGNSGEISCSIVSQFSFPRELLELYDPEMVCISAGADYTIPEETITSWKK